MTNKRLQLARLLLSTGVEKVWSATGPASLLVVNYHRLRPAAGRGPSRFDDGVFGPDADTFRRQMEWLKESTVVLDEQGLIDLSAGRNHPKGRMYSAVTFDDAYIDCHEIARPILDELGIRAIFFIPIQMIESRRLGWWDQAAYVLKLSNADSVNVRGEVYHLRTDFLGALRRVLNIFKLEPAERTDSLLEDLSSVCNVPLPDEETQSSELMNWDQIRAMRGKGHGIGSHTLSHRVLATLTPAEQGREIRESRERLTAHLDVDVRSFAYPVGGPRHFNDTSVALVRDAGYEQAFTFNTGMNSLPIADRFRICRESAHSFDLLKAKVLMPALMGIREKRVS